METENRQAPGSFYGAVLARIHHDHFGMTARAAAEVLLQRLEAAGTRTGKVVDLAVGTGILSGRVVQAGYSAWGVDLSEEMLRIAEQEAPGAELTVGSLWEVEIPPCEAVAAVGEAFCYATDPAASLEALEERLRSIHHALTPGGLLLFDVAGPGRSGPTGFRERFFELERTHLLLRERECDRDLIREITTYLPAGDVYQRFDERHVLRLYTVEEVGAVLERAGFEGECLPSYGDLDLPPGWHPFVGRKR